MFDTGYTEQITNYMTSGYNALKTGKQTITVTSDGYTATFEVTVINQPAFALGDADRNGKTDVKDATLIQRFLAEYEEPGDDQRWLADADGDGSITIDDVTLLQMYIAECDVTLGVQA